MAKNDYFNIRLSSSKLPTKWLWFYVKIRLPLGIIVSIISIIYSFSQVDFSLYSGTEIVIILFFYSFDIIKVTLAIRTYIEMKKLSMRGFRLNKILLYYEILYLTLSESLKYVDTDWPSFWPVLLAGAVIGLVWLWPNMVYFNKRKYLFDLDVSTNHAFVSPGTNDSESNLTNIEGSQVKKPEDIINNIEKLSILREKGVLTEEEYQQKKRELLDRI